MGDLRELALESVAGKRRRKSAASAVSEPVPVPEPVEDEPEPEQTDMDAALLAVDEASRAAGLTDDEPIAPLLRAMTEVVTAFVRMSVTQATKVQASIQAARELSDAEAARVRLTIKGDEQSAIRRISEDIGKAADKALARRVRVFDRMVALTAAGALVIGISVAGTGGWLWGRVQRDGELTRTSSGLEAAFRESGTGAERWLSLMRWNDITGAMEAGCKTPRADAQGRRYCMVPLWIDPARSPP